MLHSSEYPLVLDCFIRNSASIMKHLKTFGLSILLLLTSISIAQKEANIWYFGNGAGLDFNSGSPVALTDGVMHTEEGCASIADASGKLLFYTNGSTVWNKNHQVMTNGSGLLGHYSSTQSAIIVPKPYSSTIYYIFTLDCEGMSNGLNYSEVDISLSGGLGAITTNKNIQLITPALEKLTAVLHNNGTDIWVITHEGDSDAFYSYLVTQSGVNALPIVSNSGTFISVTYGSMNSSPQGYMKVSPDGRYLAVALSSAYYEALLFEFDNITGIVSNPITLLSNSNNTLKNPYGVEFSPNGKYLYIETMFGNKPPSNYYQDCRIYQFDLNDANIPLSGTIINDLPGTGTGALQLGPDGKIYVIRFASSPPSFISVIDKPNKKGLNCGFLLNAISLNGRECQFGLPSFIQSYFYTPDDSDDPDQNSSNVVYLPTAFSPNGDGRNDELYVRGENIDKIELIIYNRLGELVFTTKSQSSGWDGTHRGEMLNSDVFIANLNVTFSDGETNTTESLFNDNRNSARNLTNNGVGHS
ncbi:MAG TPA: T9SS type B sorting domain-containing protein, partial [Bacteroidetes bacterium]|nr:T9SS type B sorting domain-containing protein [Bacteroidota bacterium]